MHQTTMPSYALFYRRVARGYTGDLALDGGQALYGPFASRDELDAHATKAQPVGQHEILIFVAEVAKVPGAAGRRGRRHVALRRAHARWRLPVPRPPGADDLRGGVDLANRSVRKSCASS